MLSRLKGHLFRPSQKSGVRAGLALAERTFALAVVRRDKDAKPSISYCATHAFEGEVGGSLK